MGSERRYILPFPNKNICLNVECRSSSSPLHPVVVKVGGGSPVLLGILLQQEWVAVHIQEFSSIPLEHTPDPEPTVYEGIPFIWGFGEAWGMLQGYVGVDNDDLLTSKQRGQIGRNLREVVFFFFFRGSRLREDGRTWRSDEEPLDFGQRRSGGFGWVWWRNHVGLVLIIVGKNI